MKSISKKMVRFASVLLALGGFIQVIGVPALAYDGSSLAYEGFSYNPGPIATQNGGFGWGGKWTNVAGTSVNINIGSLIGGPNVPTNFDAYSQGNFLCGSGGSRVGRLLDCSTNGFFAQNGFLNVNRIIGAAGKTLYVSFLQQPGVCSSFYEFEFHRGDYGDPGRIGGIGNDTSASNVYFRTPKRTFSNLGSGETSVDFYVVRIDFRGGNDDVRVYRNPTSLTEPQTPTLTILGAGDMSFDRFSVGVWGNYVAIDEIRVGTAWTNAIGLASSLIGSVQSVVATNSTMIGAGIAQFVPLGFDPNKTPSLSLLAEPVSTGTLTSNWSLVPQFTLVNSNACASLVVPPGTSLYGGGEVTGLLLRNGQTIELWNTDTGAYGVDNGRRLYQAHPWVLGVRPDGTAFGVIFDSSWKSTLSTGSDRISFQSHGPLFRVFVIDRESPQAVLRGLAELTGTLSMPPRWAIGYQQCRFSYSPDSQVRQIADTFRAKQIPCDAIWMDIDYMNGYRVFTFNPSSFPNPAGLNSYLHNQGFHSVWMIDPGVKYDQNYNVYRSGTANDVWVKTSSGAEYRGKVWPGACAFPDFTRPETRSWWAGLYATFMTNGIDGIWNDVNEPAVMDGLFGTMPYDNWHRGGGGLPPGPHLLYHNVYGRLMVQASYEGILAARPDRRPFVLSRANFLGGQRYAATWTGDNGSWSSHMLLSVPMSLTLGLSGQPFSGPDIGGFLENATPELWGNWIGFGAFFPFARGHANAGTNQKEPWALGDNVEDAARIALNRRYRLLPYLYTLFHNSSQTGVPIMQPVFFADTKDMRLRAEQQAFLVGSDLMVTPSWAQNPALPSGIWRPLSLVDGDSGDYQAQLKIRGGAIIPAGAIVQNTTQNSFNPLTLIVCLDANGHASGTLYRDAGDGWEFQSGDYSLQTFTAQLTNNIVMVKLASKTGNRSTANTPIVVQVVNANGTFTGSGTIENGINVSIAAPVFTLQPSNQYTAVGNTVTLSAFATNDNPVFYQWYHESNAVPGATGTNLVLINVKAGNAGNYWVVASNSLGITYSQVAQLIMLGVTNGILAQDAPSNYVSTSFAGNQGFGFGPWVLNTVGGGSYISGDTPPRFSIWNGAANGQSTAERAFNVPLLIGATLTLQLQMNTLDNAANQNGFKLVDAKGNVLFCFWHQGGDNANGHYTDADGTGTAVGFKYDYGLLDNFKFTLNSATNYTFTDITTAQSFSGRVSGEPIAGIVFFRVNGSVAPGNGQDFKFGNLTITAIQGPSMLSLNERPEGWSLSFAVTPGAIYRVQRATNILGPWINVGTLNGPATGISEFVDTNGPACQSFYRTVTP